MSFVQANARLVVQSVALACAGSALAQSNAGANPSALRETVVTATRSEQLVTEALPHTTVIGRDFIERSQAVDLPSLLASEAGFQFTQNGGRGMATSLMLRGSASLQMLVMVDGVPLTRQDTTGAISLEHLMLDQIERVEVVRGNVSAIYGSGAIGGVIQIFMRQGQGPLRMSGQLETGSYGSQRVNAAVRGQVGDTRFALGAGQQKTRGFSANNTAQYPFENPDADGYRNNSYSLSLSHELAKGHTMGVRAQGSDGRFDTDGGGFGGPTDIYKGRNTLGTWSAYSHNQISRQWRSELTYSEGREKSVYDATLTAFPYDSWATTRSRTLNWTNLLSTGPWLVTAGGERQTQGIDANDSTATALQRDRHVSALFAGISGSLGAHSVQWNLRQDRVEGLGSKSTGYAGYGFQWTPQWKLLASTSTAFNVPPLGYLYDLFSGNPALRPETARSHELGLQWSEGAHVMRATAFRTRITDMLLYDPNTFTFNNVTDASNQGVEISYSGRLQGADVRASLTGQDPRDRSTGQRLVRRATQMASAGLSLPLGAWSVGGDVRYTGSRPETAGKPELGGFALANVRVRYTLTPELALTARIDNLLDREYQTAWGYNQARRGLYLGLVWAQK